MSNSYDFTSSFEKSIEMEAGFGGFSFTASDSVKTVEKQSETREEVFTYVFANSAIHVVSLDLDGAQAEFLMLNKNFKSAVQKLPAAADDKAYGAFIKKFGTHFMSEVPLGGMAWSRVSSRNTEQLSSKENERAFKIGATAELKSFTAGISKTESRNQVAEQDKKLGITRSEIHFVGGTGDVTEVSSSWVESLDEKSAPICEGLALTRLSTLLTAANFPDEKAIGKKQKLLDEATSRYIRQKGGDEGGRIRYGQPVQLLAASNRALLYYHTTGQGFLPLFPAAQDRAIIPGASAATFVIHGPNKVTGEEVMTGDLLTLEIKGAKTFVTIETIPTKIGPQKLTAVLKYSSNPGRPEGEYSLRIRGSGQRYEGPEREAKRRPVVSGDIVMISRREDALKKFVCLSTRGASGVIPSKADTDQLFDPPDKADICEFFVIKNA